MHPFFLIFYVKRANLLKGLVTLGQANLMFVPITFCFFSDFKNSKTFRHLCFAGNPFLSFRNAENEVYGF